MEEARSEMKEETEETRRGGIESRCKKVRKRRWRRSERWRRRCKKRFMLSSELVHIRRPGQRQRVRERGLLRVEVCKIRGQSGVRRVGEAARRALLIMALMQ